MTTKTLLATVPASAREMMALEGRVFENLKAADRAARDYLAQFPADECPLYLVYRLAGTLGIEREFFTRGGAFISDTARAVEVAA
jgi:hypothetical protein